MMGYWEEADSTHTYLYMYLCPYIFYGDFIC